MSTTGERCCSGPVQRRRWPSSGGRERPPPPSAGVPSLVAPPPGAGAPSLLHDADRTLPGGTGAHPPDTGAPHPPPPAPGPSAVTGNQLRVGARGSEDAAVEDTIVGPTSDATGVRAGAPPFPFRMPPWTPTPNTLVEAALAWDRERKATDALEKHIAHTEQLLTSPASHDGGATSSSSVGVGTRGDLSISEFYRKMKGMVDSLGDLGWLVEDCILVLNVYDDLIMEELQQVV
ncbi:mucin-7-like [Sorghum bicolor]|uniref:mucin-7-like n=1 Tax=Sorghum bicolor TaxID=4558 RepID=UPI000B4268A8|nr:mucin-7-like [Sorghum bicolor]|eukprot:XP_021319222.1 mucin-7-like [Sorghum bicolor]